jgi:hypothetical protein
MSAVHAPRILVFKCDYRATYPLWLDGRGADPASLNLSRQLRDDLRAHQANFDQHYVHIEGWTSDVALERFEVSRRDLRARLVAELGDRYIVKESYRPLR